MKRQIWIPLALATILVAAYGSNKVWSNTSNPLVAPQVAEKMVPAIRAEVEERGVKLRSIGNIQATQGVDISSPLSGTITAVLFESGADVKKGDPLARLAVVDDVAKLQAMEATAALSKLTYDRNKQQVGSKTVSQHALDTSETTLHRDVALVNQQRAILELKYIAAPFSGALGIRRVSAGQYVEAGTQLVTLQNLDSVYLDFRVPQQAIGQIKIGQSVIAKVDTYSDRDFSGTVTAINRSVDADSRNIQIRATIENADHALIPGMFASVEIDTNATVTSIAVPQTAINYHPYGNTVFIAEPSRDPSGNINHIAREVLVTVGESYGDQIAILSGITAGQWVVTAGQNTLANDMPVRIDKPSKEQVADQRAAYVDQ